MIVQKQEITVNNLTNRINQYLEDSCKSFSDVGITEEYFTDMINKYILSINLNIPVNIDPRVMILISATDPKVQQDNSLTCDKKFDDYNGNKNQFLSNALNDICEKFRYDPLTSNFSNMHIYNNDRDIYSLIYKLSKNFSNIVHPCRNSFDLDFYKIENYLSNKIDELKDSDDNKSDILSIINDYVKDLKNKIHNTEDSYRLSDLQVYLSRKNHLESLVENYKDGADYQELNTLQHVFTNNFDHIVIKNLDGTTIANNFNDIPRNSYDQYRYIYNANYPKNVEYDAVSDEQLSSFMSSNTDWFDKMMLQQIRLDLLLIANTMSDATDYWDVNFLIPVKPGAIEENYTDDDLIAAIRELSHPWLLQNADLEFMRLSYA